LASLDTALQISCGREVTLEDSHVSVSRRFVGHDRHRGVRASRVGQNGVVGEIGAENTSLVFIWFGDVLIGPDHD
jgi:hypothetical protein